MVSIHAPAWGATPDVPILRIALGSFNPRARMGRDIPLLSFKISYCYFYQSAEYHFYKQSLTIQKKYFLKNDATLNH